MAKREKRGWESITYTERMVIRLLLEGLSNPEIGRRLNIGRRTVATHLEHIFAKLDISSRTQLAAEAVRQEMKQVPSQLPDFDGWLQRGDPAQEPGELDAEPGDDAAIRIVSRPAPAPGTEATVPVHLTEAEIEALSEALSHAEIGNGYLSDAQASASAKLADAERLLIVYNDPDMDPADISPIDILDHMRGDMTPE